MKPRITEALKPLASATYAGVSLALVWEAVGRILQFHPQVLPVPSRILLEIWDQAPRLRAHGIISSCEIIGGYLLAVLIAAPVAILITLTPGARRAASPILALLRPAPLVILTPVFFIWFGFGIRPEVLIAFTLCFFTITWGMLTGLDSASPDLIDLVKTMGASRAQLITKVLLPASLPSTFKALKAAVPLAVVGATAGEFAQAETGLGFVTLAASFKLETPMVFAGLTLLGLIGLALYVGVVVLQAAVIPWHVEATRQP
jgi:NitT/TauT family transport system permease protein